MKRRTIVLTAVVLILGYSSTAQAQMQTKNNVPYFNFGKGLGITSADSLFSTNIRFRMQNKIGIETMGVHDFTIDKVEARVRRSRLSFDGFVYSPRLTYKIELFFSRGDLDHETLGFSNIISDAFAQYAVTKSFSVGFGQGKLPGNRERVVSSGALQFVDRSIVNGTFNIDRDFGAQFKYKKEMYAFIGAISTGEGRNISNTDRGLAYTGRVEFLPFGKFADGGDYFQGDLAREKTQKVSIGFVYSHNENTTRAGGQLGKLLYSGIDVITQSFDFLYKYNGWSFASEVMKRTSPTPVTTDDSGNARYAYVGVGQNYQGSYLFKNNIEIAGRYSLLNPGHEIAGMEEYVEQYTMGVSKYIKGHKVKLQSDMTLEQTHMEGASIVAGAWIYRFQVEIGI